MSAWETMGSAGSLLLACAVKSGALLAAALGAARLLRRRSAALRHYVLVLGIVASVLLPVLAATLPGWPVSSWGAGAGPGVLPKTGALANWKDVPGFVVRAREMATPSGAVGGILVGIWLLGFVAVGLRVAGGITAVAAAWRRTSKEVPDEWRLCARRICRSMGIRRGVVLRESPRADAMPMTWGFFRPEILLPSSAKSWPKRRLEIVLAHELVHVRRSDWVAQMFAEFACGLYWFQPLVWVATREMRRESERACDGEVLEMGVTAREYAGELLDLARTLSNGFRGWSAALAMARLNQLERRIKAMFDQSVNRGGISGRWKTMGAMVALFVALPVAAVRLPAQGGTAKLIGTVSDSGGAGIQNVAVALTNLKTKEQAMAVTDATGKYTLNGLAGGEYQMTMNRKGYAEYEVVHVVVKEGESTTRDAVLHSGGEDRAESAANAQKAARVVVPGPEQAKKIVKRVQPVYPDEARKAGVQGQVDLRAVIDANGKPESLEVMNPEVDPRLAQSAMDAVRQWRYNTTLLNGRAVEVVTKVEVIYTLAP